MNSEVDDRHLTAELRILFGLMAKTMRVDTEARLQAANIEVSHLQIGLLRVLNYDGGKTISELSKVFMCDPSTLVPSSEGLVRKGYLHRIRDPQDRRRVLLYITPDGSHVLDTLNAIAEDDILLTCVRQMGLENAQQLLTYLRQMIQLLPGGAETYAHIQNRILAHVPPTSPTECSVPTADNTISRE